ncbi:amino acid permease [Jonesiaceae bacterium BS-20]|uniref:Amino acid permease n=1 Tax=Jonesiaceae bacterium BS-20 TaxID=3120821 RepID=A0AAU7DZ90_9MICO
MSSSQLSHGLKVRHLTMMGLGSAIGAGLFVGTGQAISTAGPAVIISYLLAGAMVIVVMMLLAEMAAAMPSSGAFSTYAEKGVGRWAGFAVGWSYWFMLIMVLGVEILAATQIISGWFPQIPQWATATTLVLLFAVVNLAGVKNFGEMEFWFAAIKVGAIIAFLVVGVLLVTGVIPGPDGMGLQKLFSGEGGFAPRGLSGIAAGLLAVMFAFGGIEIITIAAAEATNPSDSIKRATSSIMWRILVFYVGSILVMLMVLPWNDPALVEGSFVAVLNVAKIPGAATLMEIVIVVALLSAFNAQIYGTSRMAFSLSQRGDGSRALLKVSKTQVPYVAVLVSVFFALVAVGLNALDSQGSVMGILLDAVGATLLIIWAFIALAQIRMRPGLEASGRLKLRTVWHPYLGIGAIGAIGAFSILMLFDPVGRRNLLITLGIFAIIVGIYFARQAIYGKDSDHLKGDRLNMDDAVG